MRKWLLGISLAFLGVAMLATDADARRLGGGRSVGAQRSVTPPPASAKPAPQQQAAPQQTAPQAAPQAQPSRWGMLGGILGGLAIGGLLGYLFGGNGLFGVLILAVLAIAIIAALRAVARRSANPTRPVQLAGFGDETVSAPPPSQGAPVPVASSTRVPTGFDTTGFLRAAKMNFIKLQVANDSGRLDEIREFTTQEMYDELRRDTLAGAQQTDVVALNADLLELATEKDQHWASVRFSGMVRETPGTEPVGFEEVWNLVKPTDGSSGWLLAGIQQMH
jgi:predicted lipid-binding transport protein (Tim44 family)